MVSRACYVFYISFALELGKSQTDLFWIWPTSGFAVDPRSILTKGGLVGLDSNLDTLLSLFWRAPLGQCYCISPKRAYQKKTPDLYFFLSVSQLSTAHGI